jgi:hypothetical protein
MYYRTKRFTVVLQFEDFHRMGGGIAAAQPQTVTNNCKKMRRRTMTTSIHYMVFKALNRSK